MNEIIKWIYGQLLDILSTPAHAGGIGGGVHMTLGSGYDKGEDMAMKLAILEAAGEAAISDPGNAAELGADGKVLKTHCNRALQQIANAMGCFELDGKLMNDQIEVMANSPEEWEQDSMTRAVAHALSGGIAVAALSEFPHGHGAVIAPRAMENSETWGGEPVCMIYNVGHHNGLKRLSGGFFLRQRSEIKFYLWKPS